MPSLRYQHVTSHTIRHVLIIYYQIKKYYLNFQKHGLSDHRELISTIMKSGRVKGSLRKKVCRSFTYFNIDIFKIALQEKLIHLENDIYNVFSSDFRSLLNELALLKKMKIRKYNNNNFITKELRKEIINRSKMKNLSNKNKKTECLCKHKIERNNFYYIKKTKKQHFKNLDIKEVTDNENSEKTSNVTLAKVTQIQKKSCC